MKTSSEQPAEAGMRRFSLNGATMGTRYSAVFYAPAGVDVAAIGASLFAAVDLVDRQMSNWQPDSDLCRLNAAPENTWVPIPDELAFVLEAGLQIGAESNGAFDMGVGALVEAWGFGPARMDPSAVPPAPAAAWQCATAANLEVERARGRARKHAPLCLDLCGIAKGYGVDRLAECLQRLDVTNYLVGIDGEMRARGGKPDGQAWTVAIEKPSYGVRELAGSMELTDTAIASSGDYRHWVDLAGRRYAHTMNPVARQPVSNHVAGITVLAETCMLADAWATALLVLGEHEGARLARERGMEVLLTVRDGGRLRETWFSA